MTSKINNSHAVTQTSSPSCGHMDANFFGRWIITPITSFIEIVKDHPKISISLLGISAIAAIALRSNWTDIQRRTNLLSAARSHKTSKEPTKTHSVYIHKTNSQEDLDYLFTKCKDLMDPFEQEKILETVLDFIQEQTNKLPKHANNAKNNEFLAIKLATIIADHEQHIDQKKIFKNALSNFAIFITESVQRIEKDLLLDTEFRLIFEICPNAQITNIEILGDETHNKGKNPLLVVINLSNNKKIVYKPRSMRVEKTLCGQENSVFKAFKLPTYRIYDKAEEGYGYCEFLENNQSENTFQNKTEIEEYIRLYVLMDQICSELGITDLHYQNVVTSFKFPYLIDAEAIEPIRPGFNVTGLLQGVGPGYSFASDTKNRIWVSQSVLNECSEETIRILLSGASDIQINPTNSIDALNELGVLNVINEPKKPFTQTQQARIDQARGELSQHKHRIALVSTFDLKSCIKRSVNKGFEVFREALNSRLAALGFVTDYSEDALKNKFEYDVLNNDAPIFYFFPAEGNAYYHDICLGRFNSGGAI